MNGDNAPLESTTAIAQCIPSKGLIVQVENIKDAKQRSLAVGEWISLLGERCAFQGTKGRGSILFRVPSDHFSIKDDIFNPVGKPHPQVTGQGAILIIKSVSVQICVVLC